MSEEPKAVILNVDDDEASRYAVSRILKQAGYEVIEAATGQEALRQVRSRPDLVLLDVQLPDLLGFEVCRQIKADPATATIPVLMLSATHVHSEAMVEGLTEGAEGYLAETIDPKVLVAYVNALLRTRQAETEQARLLRENQQQRQLLERLVESAPVAIAVLHGPEHRYVLANPEYRQLTRGKGELVGRTVAEAWPELAHLVLPLLDHVYATGEPYHAVDAPFQFQRENGLEEVFLSFNYIRLSNEQGRPEGILVLAQETTAQVYSRMQLEEAYALLDTIFDSAPVGLGFWDRELRFTRVNGALAEINGLPVEAHIGKRPHELLPNLDNLDEIEKIWREVLVTGRPVRNVEVSGETPADPGRTHYWLENWYPVRLKGEVIGIGAVVQEITERKQMEQQLRASLQEKEILLKEVHHRVKNNLQAVSNLLYMQSIYARDDQTREGFRQSQDRIKSIALIHEKLYQSRELIRLDFAEYVESLVAHLINSYNIDPGSIRLHVRADHAITLDLDTAVPMGIIINELVSNSLKHAFPEHGRASNNAEIRVELRERPDNGLLLVIADNGIGLAEEPDLSAIDTLGLKLVHSLVAHMDGTLEVNRSNGTEYNIQFSPPPVI